MQEILEFVTRHPYLNLAALTIFLLLLILELLRAKRNIFNINPVKVVQLMNHENAAVIDIRSSEAYKQGHIIESVLMPAQTFSENTKKLEKFKSRPIIIVADTNPVSQKMASQLLKQGYNAYALTGGIRAWNDAQMPLVKG